MQNVSGVKTARYGARGRSRKNCYIRTFPRSDTATTAQGNNVQSTACIKTDVLILSIYKQTFSSYKTPQKRHKTHTNTALLQQQDTDSTAHGTAHSTVFTAGDGRGLVRHGNRKEYSTRRNLLRSATGRSPAPGTSETAGTSYGDRDGIYIIREIILYKRGDVLEIPYGIKIIFL